MSKYELSKVGANLRVSSRTISDPFASFNVLFFAHKRTYNIDGVSVRPNDAVEKVWRQIRAIEPFSYLGQLKQTSPLINAYFADNFDNRVTPLDVWPTRVNRKRMEIPSAGKNVIRDFIAQSYINYQGDRIEAKEIWPVGGKFGQFGSLVIILNTYSQEGELYELNDHKNYPIPVVAANINLSVNYVNVFVRAIAQVWAGLGDEFELPGNQHLKPQFGPFYENYYPNLIFVSDTTRAKIGKDNIKDIISTHRNWINKLRGSYHIKNKNPNVVNDKIQKPENQYMLVEGGGNYRQNVFRSSSDCFLRRQPYAANLSMQAGNPRFCPACLHALRGVMAGFTPKGKRSSTLLDSQSPLADQIKWTKIDLEKIIQDKTITGNLGNKPMWSFKISITKKDGLIIENIKLKDRPSDPFNQAEDVFKKISFRDLEVKFNGESKSRSLSFSSAMSNKKRLPVLKTYLGRRNKWLGGYALTLSWDIPGNYTIEGILQVVFRDSAFDFDPGGSAQANKIYPQLILRYIRPAGRITSKLKKVEWLKGKIHVDTANIFPTTIKSKVNHHLHHMIDGKQQLVLASDSNVATFDANFIWDHKTATSFFAGFASEVPKWGLWGTNSWKKGRFLEGFFSNTNDPRDPEKLVIPTARVGHERGDAPVLPHWSWLFDYVVPDIFKNTQSSKTFVAAYHIEGRLKNGDPARKIRKTVVQWPPDQSFFDAKKRSSNVMSKVDLSKPRMTIKKFPRQGMYDNVHIHPSMGRGQKAEIVPAPFCADLCMHLHFRWGQTALIKAKRSILHQFKGWGDGKKFGAHAMMGAPLTPPNQQVEIDLYPPRNPAQPTHSFTYIATAMNPDYGAYQVFMEQGIGIAYNYNGISTNDLSLLLIAMGLKKPFDEVLIGERLTEELEDLFQNNPVAYDMNVRHYFHKIYELIRWYRSVKHSRYNQTSQGWVQQVPGLISSGQQDQNLIKTLEEL